MQVDIRAKDKHNRVPVSFECGLDLISLRRFGETLFPRTVQISGSAVYNGDYYDVSYVAGGVLHTVCSRCLKDMENPFSQSFSHVAMESDDEISPWSDTITLHDGMLDVHEMAVADLLLQMEGVALCSEDCPGLCPVCGRHMDEGCSCDTSFPDPRFDALRELMDNDDEAITT